MNASEAPDMQDASARGSGAGSVVRKAILHGLSLLVAVAAFTAYQHFKLQGDATPSLAALIAAAAFAAAPVRALVGGLFEIEGKDLHVVHGLGGLAFAGLSLGGVISGAPVLRHAALAPFAIMGAAQAVMHQDHPRNARQAEALRRFAASLPEVAQFTGARDLSSPANAARAVAVLGDILAEAQALGETELQADPGFQSALERVTTRSGLSLGLDVVDQAIGQLAENPAAAGAIGGLRERLAAARRTLSER